MADINNIQEKLSNLAVEMQFVGCLYLHPDWFVTYSPFVKSKYDFSDECIKFFYDSFSLYYTKVSDTVNEVKINSFMASEETRLSLYKKYKGWSTLTSYMNLVKEDIVEQDCKNYFNILKKYSLLREFSRKGFAVEHLLNYNNFESLTANDIYRLVRINADRINTVINAGEEAVDLTNKNEEHLDGYLTKPIMGLYFPWKSYNDYFLGLRKEKVLFEGFLSNEGKTRKLVLLAAYIVLVQKQNFLFMSNEMGEEDLRSCLITTVLNNEFFQQLHGVHINKPEKEIVMGQYHDNNGDLICRKVDPVTGTPIEPESEFIERIKNNSEEYWQVKKVVKWIDDNSGSRLLFKDVGDDYSPQRIEFELRKAKTVSNIIYYGYDTLKGYNTDDWSAIKQFATKLKELTKELAMSGFAVYQLSDDTVFTDIFKLSSNNIANAKQIKHIADILTIGKRIPLSDYSLYRLKSFDDWGVSMPQPLDVHKSYFAIKIDKNRAGSKDRVLLFEINLDYNTWYNVGFLESYQRRN